VSRGLGRLQRRIVDALAAKNGDEASTTEIARALEMDTPTGRRQVRAAVAALERRDLVIVERRQTIDWHKTGRERLVYRSGEAPDRPPDFVVKEGERWPMCDGRVLGEGEDWPRHPWYYYAREDTKFWRVPEELPVVGSLVWLKTVEGEGEG
jgi:hypothetical protein